MNQQVFNSRLSVKTIKLNYEGIKIKNSRVKKLKNRSQLPALQKSEKAYDKAKKKKKKNCCNYS